MSCGLSKDALYILNILYTNRCFASNRGYNSNKLSHICDKKLSSNFKNAIKELKNGYITPIRKKDLKYYISDIKIAIIAPNSHGYNVTKGRMRPL